MAFRITAFILSLALLNSSAGFGQANRLSSESFRAKMLHQSGNNWREKDVMLQFEPGRVVLRSAKNEDDVKVFQYSSINSAEYSYSKSRRKLGLGATIAAGVFALPLMMSKVEQHWLTIKSGPDEAVLHLSRKSVEGVIATFESNTGRRVMTIENSDPLKRSAQLPTKYSQ